jgi:hypothetical protein
MKEALEPWQRILRGAGAALEKAICRSLTREADGKPDVASSHAAHWGDYRKSPSLSGIFGNVVDRRTEIAAWSALLLRVS